MKLTVIRNGPKWTISVSGGLGFGLLQMVSEQTREGVLTRTMGPKGVDCEIPHQLERETKHSL